MSEESIDVAFDMIMELRKDVKRLQRRMRRLENESDLDPLDELDDYDNELTLQRDD